MAREEAYYPDSVPLPIVMPVRLSLIATLSAVMAFAQAADSFSLPTGQLLSEAGPTFRIADKDLPSPLTFIVYGDQRFTDPENVTATDPRARRFLVSRIAEEKPAAVILNGDVPYDGNVKSDYDVYYVETKPWRDAHLHVYPALGNHEFRGDPARALENWWNAYPDLRNRRWYSVQLGSRVYALMLDSNALLTPGSDQARWIDGQLKGLPPSIDAVVLSLHHPPVADKSPTNPSHDVRPNEAALRDYLATAANKTRAKFIVSAGHIHNYERHSQDGIVYLVSGGGGAKPAYVNRTPDDLYKSILFPNYHYVKVALGATTLHAEMFRIENPEAATLSWEKKDDFEIPLGGTAASSVVH